MSTERGSSIVFVAVVVVAMQIEVCAGAKHCGAASCGDIRNSSFPFRLKRDDPSCGIRELELVCDENNHTTL